MGTVLVPSFTAIVILSEDCSVRDQRKEQPQSKDPYSFRAIRKLESHPRIAVALGI
jgi:hypothetical protein